MSKVAVVIDSTTFLPKEYLDKYNIRFAPARIIWEDGEDRDAVDIQPSEFYARLRTESVIPTTTQAPAIDFKTIYDELHAQGKDILTIVISSKFSGMFLSAEQARGMMPEANIEVIDSLSGSMGAGWPILKAAEAAASGASLAECKAIAENALKHVGILLTVDTLEYLHKGGRIGGASRFLGAALNLKPILEVVDGAFEGLERVRTREKSLSRLVELYAERIGDRRPVNVAALHADAPDKAQELLEKAKAVAPVSQTLLTDVSPAIGVHLGPGTVGLAFMAGVS